MKIAEKILLWLGTIVLMGGILLYRLWEQWSAIRFFESLFIGLIVLTAAWLFGRSFRQPLATKILLLWIILLAIFAGLLPVLATVILIASAIVIGVFLLPHNSAVLQALLGMLLLTGLAGWLLLLPIHYGWSYLLLCLVLIRCRWRSLIKTLKVAYLQWDEAVATSPRIAAFCIIVLGLAAITCWLPVMQFDDQTYHLRLPWQLQEHPQYQIWAVAPWLSDVVQALVMLIGGKEAIGSVNIFWIISMYSGIPATSGTVVLAALPIIVGVQMLLSWLNFDIAAEPRQPVHIMLTTRKNFDR